VKGTADEEEKDSPGPNPEVQKGRLHGYYWPKSIAAFLRSGHHWLTLSGGGGIHHTMDLGQECGACASWDASWRADLASEVCTNFSGPYSRYLSPPA